VFTTKLLGKQIKISDSKWYLPTYDEIWVKQIYKFETDNNSALIIDCGANVGLSVIYWKYLYPESRIIAFEPDPKIFQLLQSNISEFDYKNIELQQAAVWISNGELLFLPDGSVGGKLVNQVDNDRLIKVRTIQLLEYLNQPVEVLKIDIEGAEFEVLQDCATSLGNVNKIFLEYHGSASKPQNLQIVLQILQEAGFRYHIKEANPVEHPFVQKERSSYYDLQLNIYGFRQ